MESRDIASGISRCIKQVSSVTQHNVVSLLLNSHVWGVWPIALHILTHVFSVSLYDPDPIKTVSKAAWGVFSPNLTLVQQHTRYYETI